MNIDKQKLRPLLHAYASNYGAKFVDDPPSDDWRKESARRYQSCVRDVMESDEAFTPATVRDLLTRFQDMNPNGQSSLSARLNGPLSLPKWETLLAVVDKHPQDTRIAFSHLLRTDRPLADRLRLFRAKISTERFNAVGAKIDDGTKSVSPSPLFGLPTTLLMFAYPDRYISYQYRWFCRFFGKYTDYEVEIASNTDLVSQYTDVLSGARRVREELEPMLSDCSMLDVRNIIRRHNGLEGTTPSPDTDTSSSQSQPESRASEAAKTASTAAGDSIEPNSLSEYYDAFRSLRNALEAAIRTDKLDADPENLRNPLLQYYLVIDGVLSVSSIPGGPFVGYGPQQADRSETSIGDYRKACDDGEWVRDYQQISVEPFQAETRRFLDAVELTTSPPPDVRPVTPDSEIALPETTETKAELRNALSILTEFPAYPSTPIDNASEKRLPVAELHSKLATELPAEATLDIDSAELGARGVESSSAVTAATPRSESDVTEFLASYEKLTHLFKRITPPGEVACTQSLPVFSLDIYEPYSTHSDPSPHSKQVYQYAKEGETEHADYFLTRLRDLVNRRFLQDRWAYDYITIFPSHEAGVVAPTLETLAQDIVLDTSIIYSPLLERTTTTEPQRSKSADARLDVAREPSETLRSRARLEEDTVLLLDDVCTSGSSLMAGAHLLRAAGAKRVIGLTLGVTPGMQTDPTLIKAADTRASELISGVDS